MTDPIGQRLGSFRVAAEVGAGAMGTVYRADGPQGTVALKVVHPHLLDRPGFRERFRREAHIGLTLRHENVVRTLDCCNSEIDGAPWSYLVLEYVQGQTLRELLGDLQRVPETLCRHIGREVARGLAAVHAAGVIHRDLKPENVLITPEHVVKIMDLGVAHLTDATTRLSQTGVFLGSVLYAAPEQFGSAPPAPTADLYALGLILYELGTGMRPFAGTSVTEVMAQRLEQDPPPPSRQNPQLSPLFDEVVQTLTAREPTARFASAADVAEVLDRGEASPWWAARAAALRAQTRRPMRRIRVSRETSLHARDAELARLLHLYDRTKEGAGRAVLIEGEAGIGKTRLLDELLARLLERGEELNFLFGSYPPGGAATDLNAFVKAFAGHLGATDLDRALARHLATTPLLIPAFAALLRGEPRPAGSEPLTKESLQTVFAHTTRALATERPTVVVIDDLHFAPPEGLGLLAALCMAIPGHRVLIVGTTRPGLPPPWVAQLERFEHVERMALGRLSRRHVEKLLRELFGSERLVHDLGERITDKSDGNPFFLFEILRDLRESKLLERRADGSWGGTTEIEEIRVPSSVQGLIQARMHGLEDDDRSLLDVAACCGFDFDPDLVAEALGEALVPVLKRFGRIEQRDGLVHSMGRTFAFDHHQVQAYLYADMPLRLREEYHAAIAETLERRLTDADPAGQDGRASVELCTHLLAGPQGARALPYLEAALDHLQASYANQDAIRLIDRALAIEGLVEGEARVPLLVRKARGLEMQGRAEAEHACLAEALAAAQGAPAMRGLVQNALGWHLYRTAHYDDAAESLDEAITTARALRDPRLEAGATGHRGLVAYARGRYEEARGHHEHSLGLLKEIGDPRGVALATGNLGITVNALGRMEEAQRLHEENVRLARAIGDRRGEAIATQNVGIALRSAGRLDEARAHYERGLALSRSIGDRRGEAIATGNLGEVLEVMGRSLEALDHHQRTLALSREIGDRRREANAIGSLGSAYRAQGRFEEAQARHAEHLGLARELGDRWGEALALGNLGLVERSRGRYEAARRAFEDYVAVGRAMNSPRLLGWALAYLGGLWVQAGDPVAARTCLEEALAIAEEGGMRDLTGEVLTDQARLAASSRRPQEAESVFGRAIAVHREIGNRVSLAETLVGLGRLLLEADRHTEAEPALAEAVAIADDLGLRDVGLLAQAMRAGLGTVGSQTVLEAFNRDASRLECAAGIEAGLRLWQVTGEATCLEAARARLNGLLQDAPADCRRTLAENVRTHREVLAAVRPA